MSFCSAILKSNKACSFRAKYALVGSNRYFCKKHALSWSNKLLKENYSSIESIPNLRSIENISLITQTDQIMIIQEIKTFFGLSLTIISQEERSNARTDMYVGDSHNMTRTQYMLKIIKQPSMIDRYLNGSSMYASICKYIKDPICVPIASTTIDDKMYLVRGSKYNSWYYELTVPAYPLLGSNCKKLILRLVKLIEMAQECRVVHGSIELRNLQQLNRDDISTTVFSSLRDGMFWMSRYGNTIEASADIDPSIKFDPLVCARSVQQKKYPNRHDDYESLLYLTQYLLNHKLPWIGVSAKVDIVQIKTQYLTDMIDSGKNGLSTLSTIILSSYFDDRPNYSEIYAAFESLFDN